MPTPRVVVFDVNETLSDLAPMAARFTDLGLPALTARLWFASLLRDGFALTAAGSSEAFAALAESALRVLLHGQQLDRDVDAAVRHVLDGFGQLVVHPDVPAGVRALRAQQLRLVTLTNGAAEVGAGLLERAGLRGEFEQLLSVAEPGVWKPAAGAYAFAAQRCGTRADEMLLVAVHPWDIDGAARAGLRTAWLNRTQGPYPTVFTRPELTASSLPELAELLAAQAQR